MSFLIIIRGALGIGKTTIAKKIAKLLDAEYISIDKVLEDNKLDREDNNFTPEDFIKANNIILPEINNNLEKGKPVILDGCFYFIEQIKHIEKNINFKIFVFTLKAPVEVCICRDKCRKRVYGEENARAVHNLVSKFDYGTDINTENKSKEEVVKEIIKFLKNKT